jgi:hypothetical protein
MSYEAVLTRPEQLEKTGLNAREANAILDVLAANGPAGRFAISLAAAARGLA